MTISTTVNKVVGQGNGATTAFSYSFLLPSAANAVVTFTDAAGAVTVLAPTQYTLSGVGNPSGGTLTYPVSGSPMATGQSITLQRVLPLQQLTSLINQNGYYPDVVEGAMDALEMQIQQLADAQSRMLRFAVSDTNSPQLPSAAARANSILGWNNVGDIVPYIPAAGDASSVLIQLAGTTGAMAVGFRRTVVGALASTLFAFVNTQALDAVVDFGMAPSNTMVANAAAMHLAVAAAAAIGNCNIEFPSAVYPMLAGENYASAGVGFIGRGTVVFDFSAGTGVGFKLDAGGSGAFVQRMRVENIHFKGGPAITDAFYARGIVRASYKNVRASECTTNGFHIMFAVLCHFDSCVISDDLGVQTTKPANYWNLDDDGTVGNHCQANVFTNCEAGGSGALSTSTGWKFTNAIGNTLQGGTAESLNIGADFSALSKNNSWSGLDAEDNVTSDVVLRGYDNNFHNCSFASTGTSANVDNQAGDGCDFFGGYVRWIALGAGSADTTFFGVVFESAGGLGIQGAGTFRRYNCTTANNYVKVSNLTDVLGPTDTGVAFVASQGVTPTKTLTDNIVRTTGQMAYAQANFVFTSGGTATSPILVTIPVAYTALAAVVGKPVGTFSFSNGNHAGVVVMQSAIQLAFIIEGSGSLLGTGVTITAGDVLKYAVNYPMA